MDGIMQERRGGALAPAVVAPPWSTYYRTFFAVPALTAMFSFIVERWSLRQMRVLTNVIVVIPIAIGVGPFAAINPCRARLEDDVGVSVAVEETLDPVLALFVAPDAADHRWLLAIHRRLEV